MFVFVLYFVLELSVVEVANGDCSVFLEGTDGYNVKRNKDGGVTLCEYIDANNKSHSIPVNTTFQNNDVCERCTCGPSGSLDCCGTGYNAGAIFLHEGCEMKKVDNCNYIIVTAENALKPCAMETSTKVKSAESNDFTTQSNRRNLTSGLPNDNGNGSHKPNGQSYLFVLLLLLTCYLQINT